MSAFLHAPQRVARLLIVLCIALSINHAKAAADTTTTIQATITDADGKVIHGATLLLYQLYTDTRQFAAIEAADSKGHVHLRLPNGWYTVTACAPGHLQQTLSTDAFFYGQKAELRFRLATPDISPGVDRAGVLLQADHFAYAKVHPMVKTADGAWMLDLPCPQDSLICQIAIDIHDSRIPATCSGTQSDALHFSVALENQNAESCCSVIRGVDGVAHIRFDPKLMHQTKGQAVAEFTDKAGQRLAQILSKERELMQKYGEGVDAVAAAKPSSWDVQAARESLRKDFESEHDATLKQVGMLVWLEQSPVVVETDSPDVHVIDEILQSVPPLSLVWERSPTCVMWAVRKSSNPESEYGYTVKTEHPNEWVRQIVQTDQGSITRKEHETRAQLDNARRMISAMKAEPPKDDEIGAIRRGYTLPPFSFETLDNSDQKISNNTVLGKWVLIDNWATWCGPCVHELAGLQAAYDKFKDKNFTVMSVSFDHKKEDVVKFRQTKAPMPWIHCFSPGVWSNDAARIFEVRSIPKPILIDPNGTIRAIGVELRGANLEQTLSRYIH